MLESNKKAVYLDNASTTCVDERVFDAMLPFLKSNYGNPSSIHSYGTKNKEILNGLRSQFASLIGAESEEIIFTSGGTESNNMALKGIAFANRQKGKHIIVSDIEHDCILSTCKWLETQGFFISYLPVDENGIVDLERLKLLINKQTILVSIMHVNNEIGTIQPIEEIGRICKEKGVYFHTDACQSFGKIPIDIRRSNISLMSLNAHKIYGPKGIGALYVKKEIPIEPLLHGGGQEFGLRSATENIAGIAGFVKAAELCIEEMDMEYKRISELQNRLISQLQNKYSCFYLNGSYSDRLANIISFSLSGLEGEAIRLLLLMDEKGIAISTGSACSNNDNTKSASHVLKAIGRDAFQARGGIRVSLGKFTTIEDIDYFVETLNSSIGKLNTIYS